MTDEPQDELAPDEAATTEPSALDAEEQRARRAATMDLNRELAKKNLAIEEAALKLWIERGNEFVNARAFCDAVGPDNGFDYDWLVKRRTRNKAFSRRWKAVRSDGTTNKKTEVTDRTRALAQNRWAHLSEGWKGLWLEKFRETKDHLAADASVNKTRREVESEWTRDTEFARGYAEILDEFKVAIDDGALRQAMSGKSGAMSAAVLETLSDRFSKTRLRASMKESSSEAFSMDDYDAPSTRARAKELFQRLLDPVPA